MSKKRTEYKPKPNLDNHGPKTQPKPQPAPPASSRRIEVSSENVDAIQFREQDRIIAEKMNSGWEFLTVIQTPAYVSLKFIRKI